MTDLTPVIADLHATVPELHARADADYASHHPADPDEQAEGGDN